MFSAECSLASIDCDSFEYKNVLKIQKCFENTKMLWKYKNALDIQNSSDYKMTYK